MTVDGTIAFQRYGRVGRITLRRPEKLNALAGDMRGQLRDAVTEAACDPQIGAIVLTGEGRAFCAGGDIGVMRDLHAEGDEAGFRDILHAGAECVLALQAFPGLTIAALNGVAAGAGLGLALACDLRVATPDARLIASWAGIGLAPDWGATYWLPRLLGPSRALAMILGAESLDAESALAQGLVHEIVDPGDLVERAHVLAEERGGARDMVRHVKALVNKGLEGTLEASLAAETEAQEELFAGDDVREGLAAFGERRKPRFGGDA